eukprot:3329447-Rhodomonas_salina.2
MLPNNPDSSTHSRSEAATLISSQSNRAGSAGQAAAADSSRHGSANQESDITPQDDTAPMDNGWLAGQFASMEHFSEVQNKPQPAALPPRGATSRGATSPGARTPTRLAPPPDQEEEEEEEEEEETNGFLSSLVLFSLLRLAPVFPASVSQFLLPALRSPLPRPRTLNACL